MLDGEPPTDDSSWEQSDDGSSATYAGPFGSLKVERDPFHLGFRDASGNLLTRTHHPSDARGELNSLPIPFSFVRRSYNLHRHLAATFSLAKSCELRLMTFSAVRGCSHAAEHPKRFAETVRLDGTWILPSMPE